MNNQDNTIKEFIDKLLESIKTDYVPKYVLKSFMEAVAKKCKKELAQKK